MGPTNVAMNPMMLVEELQRRGLRAAHLGYDTGTADPFAFRTDRVYRTADFGGSKPAMFQALRDVLADDFNIVHCWTNSLVFESGFGGISGVDLPVLKSRGIRVVHRFTGFDARTPTKDLEANPHSPFRYGYVYPYDEHDVLRHQQLVREHADRLVVQDPELAQFIPDATLVPRALDLAAWVPGKPANNERPLVVHAPTNPTVKGTPSVVAAVESLQRRGVAFDFKLIEKMPQAEAREWYRRADVIVDQLLIGATGVLTLEAWALGKPVVVNLRPELFEPFYGTSDLPVVQATPDTIEEALGEILADASRRELLAVEGRALVERHHDVAAIADQLLALYAEVLAGPQSSPITAHDVRLLERALCEPSGPDGSRSLAKRLGRFVWTTPPSHYASRLDSIADRFRGGRSSRSTS